MNDRRWERYGAATGIIFVILLLVVLVAFPAPPDFDAPAREVADYYVDDRGAIQASNLVGGAAMFFLIWFLGSVRSALRTAEGGSGRLSAVAFGGGLVGVVVIIFALIFSAAAAFRPEETSPELTRTLHDISFGLSFAIGAFAFLAFFAATALVTLRTGALPAPLGWLAVLAAVAQALGSGAVFEDSGAFSADGVFGYLWVILLLAWVLAASLVLVQRAGAERAAAAGPPG